MKVYDEKIKEVIGTVYVSPGMVTKSILLSDGETRQQCFIGKMKMDDGAVENVVLVKSGPQAWQIPGFHPNEIFYFSVDSTVKKPTHE